MWQETYHIYLGSSLSGYRDVSSSKIEGFKEGRHPRVAAVALTQITLNCKVVAVELHIRGGSKTYSNGVQALKDVTLTIPAGMKQRSGAEFA